MRPKAEVVREVTRSRRAVGNHWRRLRRTAWRRGAFFILALTQARKAPLALALSAAVTAVSLLRERRQPSYVR